MSDLDADLTQAVAAKLTRLEGADKRLVVSSSKLTGSRARCMLYAVISAENEGATESSRFKRDFRIPFGGPWGAS